MFGENPIEDAWLKTAALMSYALDEEKNCSGNELRLMRRVLEPLIEASLKMFPSEVMESIEFWVKSGPDDHGRFRSSEIIRQRREYEAQGLDPNTDENSEKIWAEAERIADVKYKELQDRVEVDKA